MTRFSARLGAFGVAAATAVISIVVNLQGLDALDEGTVLHLADRIRLGDVLYRDAVTGVAPAFYYLMGGLFGALGPHLLIGRLLMTVLLVSATLLVYALCRRFTTARWALASSLLFATWQALHWRLPSYSGLATVAVLLAVWLLLEALRRGSLARLGGAALAVGLAGASKQTTGALALAALVTVLLLDLVVRRRSSLLGSRPGAALALSVLGVALPLGLFLVYFAAVGAFADFFHYAVIVPLTATAGPFEIPYPSLFGRAEPVSAYTPLWDLFVWVSRYGAGLGGAINQTAIRLQYGLPLLGLAAAGGFALAGLRRTGAEGERRLEPSVLFVFALLLFGGVFPRCDTFHLVLGAALVLPATSVALHAAAERLGGWRRRVFVAGVCLVAASWIAGPVAGLVSWTAHPDPAYRHDHLLDLPRATTWVRGPIGRDLETAVPFLAALGERQAFAALPTLPIYYFLTGRPSPLRFPLILPGALDEAEVISELERQRVPWIVYRDATIDRRTLSEDLPGLYDYLRRTYRLDPQHPVLGTEEGVLLLGRDPAAGRRPADAGLGLSLLDHLESARHETVAYGGVVRPLALGGQVEADAWLFRKVLQHVPPIGPAKLETRFVVDLPPGPAELAVEIALRPETWAPERGDGVLFEVWVGEEEGGEDGAGDDGAGLAPRRIMARYLDPKNRPEERYLIPERASLAPWAGRRVTLYLVTTGGPRLNQREGYQGPSYDWAGWAEPSILVASPADAEALRVSPAADRPRDEAARAVSEIDPALLEDELERQPGDTDVLWALARLEAWKRHDERALSLLERCLDAGRESTETFLLAVAVAQRTGAGDELRSLLDRALDAHPDQLDLRLQRGNLRLAAGDPEGAVEDLEEVATLDPASYWARIGLARTWLARGECAIAREWAFQALELDGAHPAAPLVLGRCAQREGEPGEAALWFERAQAGAGDR